MSTDTKNTQKLNRREILEKELDLDPIEKIKIKRQEKHQNAIKKLKQPKQIYDHESKALDSIAGCKYGGPRVWVMTSSPEALRTIFTAIRTCYSPFDQAYIAYEEYFEYLNRPASNPEFPNDVIRLLAQVAKMRHLSTLEHVTFTFGLRCVSRATLAQLTRHRIGWSYSVQSQRYVKQSEDSRHGGFDFVVPPSIIENDCLDIYIESMEHAQKTYNKLVECGVKPEDARYVLPNAATANITVSCNLRAFIDFYEKRNNDTHSQWEIKLLAERMKKELLEVEPGLEFLFYEEEKCDCK